MTGELGKVSLIAARQFGAFNRSQAHKAGFSGDAIRRRIRSGAWLQLAPTVYGFPSAEPSWERQLAVAVLSRPRAYVAEMSAAYLHGLRDIEKHRPVIAVPETSNARSSVCRVIRHRRFDELGVSRVRGFETLTVAESVVLLSRRIEPHRIESVFDDALVAGKLDLDDLGRVLKRESDSRTKGLSVVQELFRTRSPTAPVTDGSYLESMVETVLLRNGVEGWTREFPFSIRGHRGRVDFFFRDYGLVVEADGRSWHMKSEDFESDRKRDNGIAEMGYQVLRFTHRMLTEDADACVATISRVLRNRSAQRPG